MSNNKPHGGFTVKGTITLPERKVVERAAGKPAVKVAAKPLPWGWIFMTGSLIFSFIVLVVRK